MEVLTILRRSTAWRVAFCALLLLVTSGGVAFADDAPGPVRVVVLKNGGSGVDLLVDALGKLPNVQTEGQSWFLQQIKQRGVKAHGIMQRGKDLRWVMKGAKIDYIVVVRPTDTAFSTAFYDKSGAPVHHMLVPGNPDRFSKKQAADIRDEFRKFAGLASQPEPVATTPVAAPAQTNEVVVSKEAKTVPAASSAHGHQKWWTTTLAARGFKRDLDYNGGNGAELTFRSVYYPGFSLQTAVFPSALAASAGRFGFGIAVDGGFDSLATKSGDHLPILHLEGEVDLLLDLGAGLQLHAGARYARFALKSNDELPPYSEAFGVLGLQAGHQFGRVTLRGAVDALPGGTYLSSSTLFGSSSFLYGFAGRALVRYGIGTSLGVAVGYSFRILRTRFPGKGTLDFKDTHGFELVQGPEVGVTLDL